MLPVSGDHEAGSWVLVGEWVTQGWLGLSFVILLLTINQIRLWLLFNPRSSSTQSRTSSNISSHDTMRVSKAVLSTLIIIISISLTMSRPKSLRGSLNLKGDIECSKLRSLKKSMSDYLQKKLMNLTEEQQEILAKKLISKLHRHYFHHQGHKVDSSGPWINNGEMFARML